MSHSRREHSEGLLARPFLARLSTDDPVVTRRAMLLASTGVAVEILLVATTFVPGGPLVPQAVVFLLFAAVFPLHVRTGLSASVCV